MLPLPLGNQVVTQRDDCHPQWSRAEGQERPMFTDSQILAGHKAALMPLGQLPDADATDHRKPDSQPAATPSEEVGPAGEEGTWH